MCVSIKKKLSLACTAIWDKPKLSLHKHYANKQRKKWVHFALHLICIIFVPLIAKEMKEKKERFIELLRSTGRQGIEEVISYLEKSGFFTAPASTKYHLSYEGGLMEHSMNVYDMAIGLRGPIVNMKPEVEEKLPEKSIIIAALLHDICKANIYKKTQKWNKNDQGHWEQFDTYETDYSRMPVGHGEKSVIMLLSLGLKLTLDETVAIRWHMGAWDLAFQSYEAKSNINEAGNRYPLLALLQSADNMATHILEL